MDGNDIVKRAKWSHESDNAVGPTSQTPLDAQSEMCVEQSLRACSRN